MPRNRSRVSVDKVDFHFRCQPKIDTRDGKLLRYLQSEDTELPLRQMILNAVGAFWLPYAHKYFNDLSPEELQKSVDRAICTLQMQIIYLEEDFGSRRIALKKFDLPTQELPTQKLPTPKPDDPTTQSDWEQRNESNNLSNEVAIPALSAGEWQDLDF